MPSIRTITSGNIHANEKQVVCMTLDQQFMKKQVLDDA